MTARQLMVVAWPAFLAACALEMLVFAWVDPADLLGAAGARGWSRQTVYTAAIFLFWFIAAGTCAMTLVLHGTSTPDRR
ncbi:MAG: hypothetical protein ACO248_00675 [Burkholderiaceae bacterium]